MFSLILREAANDEQSGADVVIAVSAPVVLRHRRERLHHDLVDLLGAGKTQEVVNVIQVIPYVRLKCASDL